MKPLKPKSDKKTTLGQILREQQQRPFLSEDSDGIN
jgi:hypothetical protein